MVYGLDHYRSTPDMPTGAQTPHLNISISALRLIVPILYIQCYKLSMRQSMVYTFIFLI